MHKIINKKASRDYNIFDKYEAGILLLGAEVKSIKSGGLQLDAAYVKFISGQPTLVNASVPLYKFARLENYDPKRSRRLLLNKAEIIRIQTKLAQKPGLTIVPLSCYTKGGKIKLEIGLASGKKSWQIKRVEQNRSEKRRQQKEIKEWVKR